MTHLPPHRSLPQSLPEFKRSFLFAPLCRLAPDLVSLARFEVIAGAAPARVGLERVTDGFIAGYNAMLEPEALAALRARLAERPAALHGFVVEGAAMGAAIRDGLSLRGGCLDALLSVHGARFGYLIHVGAGWARARLPWRRGAIRGALHPLLNALSLDGQGFHDAFFAPAKVQSGRIGTGRGHARDAYCEIYRNGSITPCGALITSLDLIGSVLTVVAIVLVKNAIFPKVEAK